TDDGSHPTTITANYCASTVTISCGAVPPDAQTVGFKTVALCNDFTTAIPNTVGTGLGSNWLSRDGNIPTVAGNVWYLNGKGSTFTCDPTGATGQIGQATDINGGGNLALRLGLWAQQLVAGSVDATVTQLTTFPYPNDTGRFDATKSWAHGYFEWT